MKKGATMVETIRPVILPSNIGFKDVFRRKISVMITITIVW